MPDQESTTTQTPTSPGSGEQPSSLTTSVNATPEPQEFRYGADSSIPEYLRGKSWKEAAEITDQLYKTLVANQSLAQPPLSFNQGSPLYAQAMPGQPDFQTDPLGATRAAFTQESQPRDAMLGAQARELAELKYGDDFRRWGPEIDMALNVIPPHQRTPQVVDWIVRGVRGSHMNELGAEFAERRIKQLVEGGTLRPQGAGEATGDTVSSRVDLDKLPPRYGTILKNLGVTSNAIDGMLGKIYPEHPLNKAREKWMASAMKGDVISDGAGKFYFGGDTNG